jgi:LPS export ABC transporter protein LptC
VSGPRFALLAALLAAGACTNTKGTEVRGGAVTFADSADQVFYGVQAPFETNGVKRGTLYADTMYVMNDQTRFDFLMGRVEFNTELGKPDGSMRADRGRYDQRTQVLEGWGNVVVRTVDGRSLESPHVIYNHFRDEISSDTTFKVVEKDRVSTGVGFTTDSRLVKRKCHAKCVVRGQVAIPK